MYSFPSESVIDWIPIIFESSSDMVLNLSAAPISKVAVSISALRALTFFFKRK